jgi:hypothetical protein
VRREKEESGGRGEEGNAEVVIVGEGMRKVKENWRLGKNQKRFNPGHLFI